MTDTSQGHAAAPAVLDHFVLNVRNMDESHHFWTEIVGFELVGVMKPSEHVPNPPNMRFYGQASSKGGHHHQIALVEEPGLPEPPERWDVKGMKMAINHIAIAYPTRADWLARLEKLQNMGVTFFRRIEHGMTHSAYIADPNGYGVELVYNLPREVWENDVDAALNFAVLVPNEGEEALQDNQDVPVFGDPENKKDVAPL